MSFAIYWKMLRGQVPPAFYPTTEGRMEGLLRRTWNAATECEREKAAHTGALLAEAQRLCLEYCQDEMSPELLADWEAHQVAASLPEPPA